MKICPVCMNEVDDAYQFCPEDGSALKAIAIERHQQESSPQADATGQTPSEWQEGKGSKGATVLYCTVCANEYPLTFSLCPMHGVPLSNRPIVPSRKRPSNNLTSPQSKEPDSLVVETNDEPLISIPAVVQTYKDDEPEEVAYEDRAPLEGAEITSEMIKPARASHRIAAIVTALCLTAFALFSIYVLYTKAARRPASKDTGAIQKPLVVKVPDIVATDTISEAKETAAEESRTEEQGPSANETPPETNIDRRKSGQEESRDKETSKQPEHKSAHADSSSSPGKAQTVSLPGLPSGVTNRVEARLVRARSNRIAAGYRYDLTFTMQEVGGKSIQWERLLVTTHSLGGMNSSQALSFFHRLGASGALTFTVSVEMRGRAESDWRGRVILTSVGSDNSGAPHRARFGANLAP